MFAERNQELPPENRYSRLSATLGTRETLNYRLCVMNKTSCSFRQIIWIFSSFGTSTTHAFLYVPKWEDYYQYSALMSTKNWFLEIQLNIALYWRWMSIEVCMFTASSRSYHALFHGKEFRNDHENKSKL